MEISIFSNTNNVYDEHKDSREQKPIVKPLSAGDHHYGINEISDDKNKNEEVEELWGF